MFKKTCAAVALGAAVFGVSSEASAREWWIVDFSTDTCQRAEITPDIAERQMRADPNIVGAPSIYVGRGDGGMVTGVSVTVNYRAGNSGTLWFATSYQFCEALRYTLIKNGDLVRRSDLQ